MDNAVAGLVASQWLKRAKQLTKKEPTLILMARIKDLLSPDVRRALAALAAAQQAAARGGELHDEPRQDASDRADGEACEQDERRAVSPSRRTQAAGQRPAVRPYGKPRAGFDVIVMRHARERARERFPGFKAARIVDEVHAALVAGRVSAKRPPGMIEGRGDFPYGLYAWTEDGDRIYGIMHGQHCFAVHTTMRRGVSESAA